MKSKSIISRVAKLESLLVFREFVEKACKKQKIFDQDICYDLKLAVDEACTNIITYGYSGMNPGSILLSLEMEPGQVVVTITDFGRPFEPAEAKMPDLDAELEDRSPGGYGLFFIYQTMDQISYEATKNGNRLRLAKRLPASG